MQRRGRGEGEEGGKRGGKVGGVEMYFKD